MASLINGFLFKKVDRSDKKLMEMIYRLRFEVYAKQCKFISVEDYPQEAESDEYDENSVHFAAINPRGMLVATARIILPEEQSSPLLKSFPHLPAQYNFGSESIVEISRFMICKKSRHDLNSGLLKFSASTAGGFNRLSAHEETPYTFSRGLIVQGLCQEIYKETQRRGIKYWCALMEKSLWMLLHKYGIKLKCVGDDIDIFGSVRPYIGTIADFRATTFADAFILNSNPPLDPEQNILNLLKEYSNRSFGTQPTVC